MAADEAAHLQDLGFGTGSLHRAMRAELMLFLITFSAIPCWVPPCRLWSGYGPGAFPPWGQEEEEDDVL